MKWIVQYLILWAGWFNWRDFIVVLSKIIRVYFTPKWSYKQLFHKCLMSSFWWQFLMVDYFSLEITLIKMTVKASWSKVFHLRYEFLALFQKDTIEFDWLCFISLLNIFSLSKSHCKTLYISCILFFSIHWITLYCYNQNILLTY